MNLFKSGFKAMLPIITGVIPFGAVMGTVCSEAKLSLFQAVSMNVFVFAGAAQLATVELMTKHAATLVIVATGLIINLRFLLYSAALSPLVQRSSFFIKFISAYFLTDQSYAIMMANQHKLKTNEDAVQFYLGSCVCMALTWHLSVVAGFIFGNFAPSSWALDYAVPLSFIALAIPTFKNYKYVITAIFSGCIALLLNPMPYKTGLIATAALSILLATLLTQKKGVK
ncbi:MAG: AzlC family ABC transporter permease [Oligoflexia bacterium]|nr:AzlC family ABC transporter permease [Oligoflexia bacterium]